MNRIGVFSLCVLLMMCSVYGQTCTTAQCPVANGPYHLKVGFFSQASTFWNAQAQGFLSKAGINMCSCAVSGSVGAYGGLASGGYDLILSATDNAFTRYFYPANTPGQNVTLIGLLENSALQMLGVAWNITQISDLRGKNIIVDSPTSGLIFGLRRMLAVYNLYYPRDFNMVASGATATRFNALRNGFFDDPITGQRVSIHAAVLTSPFTNQVLTGQHDGFIRSLGLIKDDAAPIPGTSLQVDPKTLSNPTKTDAITKFMAAMLLSRAYISNPANRVDVINQVKIAQSLTQAQAEIEYAQKITEPLTGEVGVDFSFSRLALSNAAFFKATFRNEADPNDPFNNVDYGSAYSANGPGKFIDYSVRDAGLTLAQSLSVINVAITNKPEYNDICVYPANSGYFYTVNNAIGGLQASTSGGCKNPAVTFTSCSAVNDPTSAPIDCNYNAATDVLTIKAATAANVNSRQYKVVYTVKDACAYTRVVEQVVTVNTGASSGCVDIRPPCTVDISSSLVNSWSANGVPTAQYNLAISNPSSTRAVTSLTLSISTASASRLQSIWNLQSQGNNQYILPSWQNGIAPLSTYTQAGYIASNGAIPFAIVNIQCSN
jgi:ABC-type nitrate/sulfonate/bicarbonate transport system substrate-binding protein